jgi:hypothetical protein
MGAGGISEAASFGPFDTQAGLSILDTLTSIYPSSNLAATNRKLIVFPARRLRGGVNNRPKHRDAGHVLAIVKVKVHTRWLSLIN